MKLLNIKSVFQRLVLLFMGIIIPLILISSTVLFFSTYILKEKILSSIYLSTENFSNTLSNDLKNLHQLISPITSYSKVSALSYSSHIMTPYEQVQAVNQVRENISNIKYANPYASNIRVYIQSMSKVYNSSGYEKGSYQEITPKNYLSLVQLNKIPLTLHYNKGRLIMLQYSALNNPANIVEVEISQNYLNQLFTEQLTYDHSYYLFQLNTQDFKSTNIPDPNLYNAILQANLSEQSNGISKITYDNTSYHFFTVEIPYITGTYTVVIPSKVILSPLQLSIFLIILLFVFIFICIIIFFRGAFILINKPLKYLIQAFREIEKGHLDTRVSNTDTEDFKYLYNGFNQMAENLEQLIQKDYHHKILLQRSELKQLQAQINPHFLYNSFFMLQRMIKRGLQHESEQFSKELGTYFKYVTRNNSDFIQLKDEYEHAKIYSHIQSLRFDGRISTEFGELPPDYEGLLIPKLSLQPIIENAFTHGLEDKLSNGLLRVSFSPHENGLIISIEDNGDHLTPELLAQLQKDIKSLGNHFSTIETTGILNIYKRFQLFFQSTTPLSIDRSDLGGLKVEIFLSNTGGDYKCTDF